MLKENPPKKITKKTECSAPFLLISNYDTVSTQTIMHLVYPLPPPPHPKFCITIAFDFSAWNECNTQEKSETIIMQNFGG